MKNKKSFTLFSTLLLIFIFSLLAVKIFETKNITSINTLNQYNYIQAKNHLVFLENYIKSLKSLDLIDTIQIQDDNFDISALIKKEDEKFTAFLSVKAFKYNVRVFKTFEIDPSSL